MNVFLFYVYIMGTGWTHCASIEAYSILDSRNYLLPQRRTRVWGVASLIVGNNAPEPMSAEYQSCLEQLRSNVHFPLTMNFVDQRQEKFRSDRHEKLVNMALEASCGADDIFVDVAGSTKRRPPFAHGVAPCVTRSHDIYAVPLGRYLCAQDFLHCQGLWKDHFGSTTWKQLLQDERFCQDLAGNSFSSTVFQSVFLSSLVAFPTSWNAIASTSEASGTGNQEGNQVAPKDVLRRIMRKRKAPEYDTVQNVQKPTKRAPRSRGQHKYNRKVPGIDSRKHKKEGQGKQHVLSIWEKEQVYLGCLYTNSIWWLCVFL